MKAYSSIICEDTLVLTRRALPAFLRLLGVVVVMVGSSLIFLRLSHGAERLLDFTILVCISFCFLPQIFRDLRRQEFVFDRRRGVFLLNGELLYPLSALENVHLDRARNILHGGNDDSFVLWLQTPERMQIEISRQSFFGANEHEIRELAYDVADWTGLDLVLPDEFVAGRLTHTVTPGKAHRFSGKRRPLQATTFRRTRSRG